MLLERLSRGDTGNTGNTDDAFETLFRRHYERIYRVLANLVGSAEADDLAQETFLALYHNPPQPGVGKDDGLVAWLCRVALNRGYNALRSQRRAQERVQRARIVPPDVGDPYDDAARNEDRAHVRAVLARLPERQRNLLLLRYAGFAYAEIAATLEIAPGSVGTLLARAERAFLTTFQDSVSLVANTEQHNPVSKG